MDLTPEVCVRMSNLNSAIRDCDGLSSAYCIGGAYFLQLKNKDYNALWENHIRGVIEEYFRGIPDSENNIEKIHKALVEG